MWIWLPLLIGFSFGTSNRQLEYSIPDPAEFYGSRLLIATLFTGIVVTVYSLLKYRGRTRGTAAWALLMLSVCVLPPAAMLVGTPLVFERAERVEFCQSCHEAMDAYVADMSSLESRSLAAVHYRNRYIPQNQCYVCHTSFGLFGTLQAKVNGVKEVSRYYLHTYARPIKMHEPYHNVDCLKCHADAARWRARHSVVRNDLFAGRSRCLDCHGDDHPAHVLN